MPKPKFVSDAEEWWHYLTAQQILGYVCALAGVVLTIVAVLVDPADQFLIAVFAAFAQILAASMFSRQGKADPIHARRSVQRLTKLGSRVSAAEAFATASFEAQAATAKRREQMGQLSVELGYISDGIYEAVRDWVAFNEPLNELVSEDQQQEILSAAKESRQAESRELPDLESTSEEPEQTPSNAGGRVR